MVGDKYDVVVVGAGPAGSMAAKAVASNGGSVLLLERDSNIGLPVRCGEGISVKSIENLIPIKDSWIAARIQGMVMYAPDGTAVTVESDDIGLVLERCLFDRWLAEEAAEAGTSILTRAEVDGLIMDGEQVKGVTYRRFGKSYHVGADVVIAADGVDSRVGRWAGLRTQIGLADLESAYQMVLAGIDFDSRYCHFYFGEKLAAGGYVWIFPKGEKTASVGIGVSAKDCDAGDAYNKLTGFIREHFGNPAIVGEMAGGVPVARPLKKPVKDGIMIAGDAARHCNPLTGGGIATAMIAGRHAGNVATTAIDAGDVSARGLDKYVSLVENDIGKPNKRAYRISQGVERLSDEVMNRTARQVAEANASGKSLKNIFLRGLATQPRLAIDIIKAFA